MEGNRLHIHICLSLRKFYIAERISARQPSILAIVYVRAYVRTYTCPSCLGMSNVRHVTLTAHMRKSTGRFTACAKARSDDGQLLSGQTAALEREQWCVHGGLGGEL